MPSKKCYKSVVVRGSLGNYNKYRGTGWDVLWSGENKICFIKQVKCSKRRK